MSVPNYFFHQARRRDLLDILAEGLVPQLPTEYGQSLPLRLQGVPIVWLSGTMRRRGLIHSSKVVLAIRADFLDVEKLHELGWEDLDWWVYEGVIPPKALTVGTIREMRELDRGGMIDLIRKYGVVET